MLSDLFSPLDNPMKYTHATQFHTCGNLKSYSSLCSQSLENAEAVNETEVPGKSWVFLVKRKEIKVITTKWLSVEFQSEKQNK